MLLLKRYFLIQKTFLMWNSFFKLAISIITKHILIVVILGATVPKCCSVYAQTTASKTTKGKTYLRGNLALDYNYFYKDPFVENQLNSQSSLLVTGEFKYTKSRFKFVAQPHIRIDAVDSYRTHVDMRNLYLSYWNKNVTINAGMRLYTLGKFTGFSLVDIMNRMDVRESLLAFEKLGQPSVDFKYLHKNISAELYVMPYFRSVNFNAGDSRLLFIPFSVDERRPQFDNKYNAFLPNISMRLGAKHKTNELVLGYFYGYNKNPDIVFEQQRQTFLERYLSMSQWSLEWQTLYRGITFTSELINQMFKGGENFFGLHVALGYDISKLYQGASTMNISVEYVYDTNRIERNLPFGNNFITLYTFNLGDIKDTTFRTKIFTSNDLRYNFIDIDMSRRVSSAFKLTGKFSFSSGTLETTDPLFINDFNTYLGIQVGWFF